MNTTFIPTTTNIPASGRTLLALLQRLQYGTLIFTAPDGRSQTFQGEHEPQLQADLRIDDWGVAAELIKSAEIGMAECYRDGRLHTRNLTHLLELCVANQRALEQVFYGKPLIAFFYRIKHWFRANSRQQAKKNISAHYDLSNDFYRLWLDNTMTYSSAIFSGASTLEAAQTAKYERILTVLNPAPGARILEIGCGWGGFAEYAAHSRGVHVTGITLSTAQLEFAQQRIANAGLTTQVDLQLIDYRDMRGEFDFIVSIEMFEAVGERYWPTYFNAVHDRLKPNGRAVIQAITIAEDAFPRYRATSDFIREFIFPGGMLAPIPRFIADANTAGLTAGEPFCFGLDYAETLKRWHEKVNALATEIKQMGFDEKFLQIWRFYFCYCEAGFRSKRTDVMQIELRKT